MSLEKTLNPNRGQLRVGAAPCGAGGKERKEVRAAAPRDRTPQIDAASAQWEQQHASESSAAQ